LVVVAVRKRCLLLHKLHAFLRHDSLLHVAMKPFALARVVDNRAHRLRRTQRAILARVLVKIARVLMDCVNVSCSVVRRKMRVVPHAQVVTNAQRIA
jgi:hypothetical protein